MTNNSRDELVAMLVELRDTITSVVEDLRGEIRLELEMERWLTFVEIAQSAIRLCHKHVLAQGRLARAESQPHTGDSSTMNGQGDGRHD